MDGARFLIADSSPLSPRERAGVRAILPLAVCLVLLTTASAAPAAAVDEADDAAAAPVNDLRAFDRVVEAFMAEHEITAATFALSIEGEIVYTAAYGVRDAAGAEPVMPYMTFRLASVSKPIAAAVVRDLVAEGRLAMDTPAFTLVNIDPPDDAEPDPRLEQITIDHLLNHRGGWDRRISGDPMFQDPQVRRRLGLERPADAHDIIRYMFTRPLDFDPGTRSAYSNFGYCVLGRAVEAVTGRSFADVAIERVGSPAGMASLALGRTYARDRNAEEVAYPIDDGELHIERMDAHGGLIANAPDLCRFMRHFWISGEPRRPDAPDNPRSYAFFGAMPGTMSLIRQHPEGVDYALLMNRFPPEFRDILPRLDAVVETPGTFDVLRPD